jgi:hypothetical protein
MRIISGSLCVRTSSGLLKRFLFLFFLFLLFLPFFSSFAPFTSHFEKTIEAQSRLMLLLLRYSIENNTDFARNPFIRKFALHAKLLLLKKILLKLMSKNIVKIRHCGKILPFKRLKIQIIISTAISTAISSAVENNSTIIYHKIASCSGRGGGLLGYRVIKRYS